MGWWFALFHLVLFNIVLFHIIVLCFFSRKRKLSGFGHRVYKNYDPRAKVLKKLTEEVFSIVGRDPLIEVLIHFAFPFSAMSVVLLKLDMQTVHDASDQWSGLWIVQFQNTFQFYFFCKRFSLDLTNSCYPCRKYIILLVSLMLTQFNIFSLNLIILYDIIWLCRLQLLWRRLLCLMSILSRGSYIQMLTSTLD